MSNDPDGPPDEGSGGDRPNPFKGTPFEQIFNQFGGALGGLGGVGGLGGPGGPGGMPDLSALMSQMQAMMAPHEGSVNWNLAKDVARRTVAQEPDPSPTDRQRADVADALRLADLWLDSATDFPSGVRTATAWSRAEWVEETLAVWRRLVAPGARGGRGGMGRVADLCVSSALRAGRRARAVRDGQRPARRGPRDGRAA